MSLGDALGLLTTVIDMALKLKEAVHGVKANQVKCQQLVNRILAIVEVLNVPNVKDRLRGKEPPQAILNLQETVTKTEDFIESYGEKSFFKKFTGWSGIKDKFEDLNQEITQAVVDCNLLLTAELKAPVAPVVEKEDYSRSDVSVVTEATDVMSSMEDHPESSLLIWVDHNKVNNQVMIKDIAKVAPNIAVLECATTTEMKSLFYINRSMKTNCTGRFRIITNRSRPSETNPSVWNEKAAYEVKHFINADQGATTPILIYTGSEENAKKLNEELGSRSPYVHATNQPTVVSSFALMSTVLWVWPGLDQNSDAKALCNHYHTNGIINEIKNSRDEAIQFLYHNPDLKSNKRFRIVITRHNSEDFVKELRSSGYNTPMLIFTGEANVKPTAAQFEKYGRVVVTATADVAKSFGTMGPLPGEQAEPILSVIGKQNSGILSPKENKHQSVNYAITPTPQQNSDSKSEITCRNMKVYGFCQNQKWGCPYNHGTGDSNVPKVTPSSPQQIKVQNSSVQSPVINKPAPQQQPITKNNSNLGKKGTFCVYKISCSNLCPKDANGLSDPYVIFKTGTNSVRTNTQMKTLNPLWTNRLYRLTDVSLNDQIIVEVWDWDMVGADDFEGQCVVSIERLVANMEARKTKTVETTFQLQPRPDKKDEVRGSITIEMAFV